MLYEKIIKKIKHRGAQRRTEVNSTGHVGLVTVRFSLKLAKDTPAYLGCSDSEATDPSPLCASVRLCDFLNIPRSCLPSGAGNTVGSI